MHEAWFSEGRVVGVTSAEDRRGKGCGMGQNSTMTQLWKIFSFPFINKKLSLRQVKQLV